MNNNVPGQIISELGEIGKKVGGEMAKVPKDIAGKAMESLGATSGTKQGNATPTTSPSEGKTAWDKVHTETDQKVKRAMARKALEELAGGRPKQKEPSIWERLQTEQDQKKEMQQRQSAAAAAQIPMATSKRPRGDLYGMKAKKTATENRNIRQD